MSQFGFYALGIIVLLVGFWVFRKVTACMFKATVLGIVAIALLILYFIYFK